MRRSRIQATSIFLQLKITKEKQFSPINSAPIIPEAKPMGQSNQFPPAQPNNDFEKALPRQNEPVKKTGDLFNFGPEVDIVDNDGSENAIDGILKQMISLKSSDLHLTIDQPIVLRIDGDVKRVSEDKIAPKQMRKLLLPIMPERNQKEFAETGDTDFAYEIQGVGRFRVNMFRDRLGVGGVLRHIPSEILTFDQLKLPNTFAKFCDLPKGLVLVTGPTGKR